MAWLSAASVSESPMAPPPVKQYQPPPAKVFIRYGNQGYYDPDAELTPRTLSHGGHRLMPKTPQRMRYPPQTTYYVHMDAAAPKMPSIAIPGEYVPDATEYMPPRASGSVGSSASSSIRANNTDQQLDLDRYMRMTKKLEREVEDLKKEHSVAVEDLKRDARDARKQREAVERERDQWQRKAEEKAVPLLPVPEIVKDPASPPYVPLPAGHPALETVPSSGRELRAYLLKMEQLDTQDEELAVERRQLKRKLRELTDTPSTKTIRQPQHVVEPRQHHRWRPPPPSSSSAAERPIFFIDKQGSRRR